MSELISANASRGTLRWKLLTSASAVALMTYVASTGLAEADDQNRPLIWIELGGQMEHVNGQDQSFAPGFIAANPDSSVLSGPSPVQVQRPPTFSFGENGKISFQPENSDWLFSAAIQIGRSSNFRHVDHQTSGIHYRTYKYGQPPKGLETAENFADTQVHHRESHAILDFQAGKDLGLGLFSKDGHSALEFGVRFAQFSSKEQLDIRARPDLHIKQIVLSAFHVTFNFPYFHTYHVTGHALREFHGVGPTLSWAGTTPFAGNRQDGELDVDWGVNAAVLFGRQRARTQHQETARYVTNVLNKVYATTYHHQPPVQDRLRNVTVPNVGGSVGLSWRVQDFKVSLGYRADFFFGAMDTGIDAAKKSNITFNGPYASISVGLGD